MTERGSRPERQANSLIARLLRLPRTALEMLTLYAGLVLLGVMLLVGTVVVVLVLKLSHPSDQRARARAAVSSLFRTFLNIMGALGIIRTDLSALDALAPAGAMIVAPNHPSLLDAVLMLSRMTDATCIMKAGLARNFFLGKGARMAGYIENDEPRSMVRQAVTRLNEGGQLLVFPEGTRTVVEPMNPLKGAFALIAKRADVPIQIVFIETDSPFLGKGWPLWKRPDLPLFYRARLGPRIDPHSLSTDEIKARTASIFEREFINGRGTPSGDPPSEPGRAWHRGEPTSESERARHRSDTTRDLPIDA